MSEVLTIPEMEARFPNEWVLIDDLETDEQLEPLRGRVLFHHPDRATVEEKAIELCPKRSAIEFMGDLFRDDMDYIVSLWGEVDNELPIQPADATDPRPGSSRGTDGVGGV